MSLHTGLSTWFVRSSSASGIQVEQLETARQSSDELQRYMQRVERRMVLVSIALTGIALLMCLATVFLTPR